MKKAILIFFLIVGISSTACMAQTESTTNKSMEALDFDSYQTSEGELKIFVIGHASLLMEFKGKIIHIDPFSNVADFSKLPKADLILLTHEHSDHLDNYAIEQVKQANTRFVVSKECSEILGYGDALNNGDNTSFEGIRIEAVPAYNIVSKNSDDEFWHPKGRGNGYILTFGDKKVYVSGDTENIPEMDNLKGSIYIAFLSKNVPYTMTDEMFVDAAKKVLPTYLYPYHFSEYNEEIITKGLKDSGIELLVRPMSTN